MPEKSAYPASDLIYVKKTIRSVFVASASECLICAAVILGLGCSQAVAFGSEIAELCDQAAKSASKARGVPYDVLRAISRAETGHSIETTLQPWPWTVNMEGTGKWFQTEDEARAYVFKHFKRGARSFDVGCFQINYKWHGSAFRSIDEMFDPMLNANYAAEFLAGLYQEYGNWSDAAGAYHSRTPSYAKTYTKRFNSIRDSIASDRSLNTFPVEKLDSDRAGESTGFFRFRAAAPIVDQGSTRLGSLMPLAGRPRPAPPPFVVLK